MAGVSEFFFTMNPNFKKKKKILAGEGGGVGIAGGARISDFFLHKEYKS